MIVETQKRDIQRSSSFEEKTMGLAVGSEAFVFNVLRKDLYSDPIGSLIREYTVNAQDEHRKHGKSDLPIAIQVPNHFSPELHIRDYAGGLTEEQVFNFFGNYGASDKRDSNVAVGFFGLGCKSAFAYTDSYIVKSFKDGMEYTFNIYIDETEIGKTAKISAEPTNEPNGILIIVPVKTNDIGTFQRKVLSTVKYFKVRPTITGMENPDVEVRRPLIAGDGWEFFGKGTANVIMGEIPYPVDYYKMGTVESWERSLLMSDISIYVTIGDVQVTASREALQMSPKTIQAIRDSLKDIKDSMIVETQKAFDKATSLVEAKALWQSMIWGGVGYADVIRNCSKGLKWKGEEISDNIINLSPSTSRLTHYFRTRAGLIKTEYSNKMYCEKDVVMHFDDTDKKLVGYKRRARTLLDAGAKKVSILHTDSVGLLELALGMSVKKLPSLNAVTPTADSSTRAGGTGVDASKRVKHASKVFVLNVNKVGNYRAASESWDIKEVDNLKGVYIPINRFQPNGLKRIYTLTDLSVALNYAEKAGIDVDVPIYGIKEGGDTTGLVRFDEWFDEQIKNSKQLIADYSLSLAYSSSSLTDVSSLVETRLPDNSVAKAYKTLYSKVRAKHKDSNRYKVFGFSGVNVKADESVMKLSEQFNLQYPMLKFVSSYTYKNDEISDYIVEKETKGEIAKAQNA